MVVVHVLLLSAVLSRQNCFHSAYLRSLSREGGGERWTLQRWPSRCCCLPTATVACWADVRRARPGAFSHAEINP